MDERTWTARLLADAPLAPAVRHLHFQVDKPEGFHWRPGQYVELFGLEQPEQRFPYSLASAEEQSIPGRFELAVRRDGSALAVERLRVGDTVGVTAPRGVFVRSGDPQAPAVFIAVGTGVAPMRAMIQGALALSSSPELLLLLGCRSEEELLWGEELEGLASRGRLRFVPTLSRPSASWSGKTGYVHAHLDEVGELVAHAEVFVCGSREMVEQATERLLAMGLPPERLRVEGY